LSATVSHPTGGLKTLGAGDDATVVRRPPPSLLLAVRDLALVGVVAFALGLPVAGLAIQQDYAAFLAEHGYEVSDVSWHDAVEPTRSWVLVVMVFAFACWSACRARAARRTVWTPPAVAVGCVVGLTAIGLVPAAGTVWQVPWLADEVTWPGPALPLRWHADGTTELVAGHAGWAYPPLVAGLLLLACRLGALAGRRPDDPASRRVTPVPRAGLALAAVVVGLPAVGGTAGAIVAYAATERRPWAAPVDVTRGMVHDVALPLLVALVTAALLSGTGPLGALATLLVAVPVVWSPLHTWLRGWAGDPALAQAFAVTVAILAVALWRGCAVWGGEILGPARVPRADSLAG
jgi:hypothetical protein